MNDDTVPSSFLRFLKKRFILQHPLLIVIEYARIFISVAALLGFYTFIEGLSQSAAFPAVMHRRIFHGDADPYFGVFYRFVVASTGVMAAWLVFGILRNFVNISLARADRSPKPKASMLMDKVPLSGWPFLPEAFCVVLGETQARDGSRVPNEGAPKARPGWVVLNEEALFTGVFTTGGVGTGKTQATVYQAIPQLLTCQRNIPVYGQGGSVRFEPYRFSGLVLDQKGDVCAFTRKILRELGREDDLIEISPTGRIYWNPIFNPNLPTWANGFVLFKILRKFNKGSGASDPFWELSPKELTVDRLQLLDDAYGYYTITDYLTLLADDDAKAMLVQRALDRHAHDPQRTAEIRKRWAQLVAQEEEMTDGLKSSLKAVARAGLKQFEFAEIRRMFSPPRDVYFHGPSCPWPRRVATPGDKAEATVLKEEEARGILIPQEHVFTGFDQILDRGKIVGINMPVSIYQDAAEFIQVAAKYAWQQAVQRRGAKKPNSEEFYLEPRFGHEVGYCPTFLMADECQNILDPDDKDFLDKCRSQKGSVWLTCQSHSSLFAAFGDQKKNDAKVIIQNCMTRIYYRQTDPDSIKLIESEVDKVERYRTSMSLTEGGQGSKVDYIQGGIVDEGKAVAETRTVSSEEKPIFEGEHLRALRKYQAIALVSTGETTLPARVMFGRPFWMFPFGRPEDHVLPMTTPYYDWPEKYTKPQENGKWVAPTVPITLHEGQTNVGGFQSARIMGSAQPPAPAKLTKARPVKVQEGDAVGPGEGAQEGEAKTKGKGKGKEEEHAEVFPLAPEPAERPPVKETPQGEKDHDAAHVVGEETVVKLLKEEKEERDRAEEAAKQGKGKRPKPLPKRLVLPAGEDLEMLP